MDKLIKNTVSNHTDNHYSQLTTYYDAQYQVDWCYMNPNPRACFNKQLVQDMTHLYCEVYQNIKKYRPNEPIKYQVLASKEPGVFNLGGDLDLFRDLILSSNRDSLKEYAHTCVENIFVKLNLFQQGITHITLVQGDALGGGFEAAISSNILVAERNAKMGLPEVLFNLFPGMGAYSILSRKIGGTKAKKMILSGKLFNAEELHALGVVDILAEDGQGELAVYDYINKEKNTFNAIQALREVEQIVSPVTLEELINIADIWVDAALKLTKRDLKMMERLVYRQSHKTTSNAAA